MRDSETLLTTERELSLRGKTCSCSVSTIRSSPPICGSSAKCRQRNVGIRVQSPDGTEGVLAAWAVEARGDKGQLKRMIVTLGVDGEGRRHVAWERQPEKMWRSAVSADNGKQGD